MADEQEQVQTGDGYACKCGYITDDLAKFRKHLFTPGAVKGEHGSLGRVNTLTGELVMPPVTQRTPQQMAIAHLGQKNKGKNSDNKEGFKTTEVVGQASSVRFVPRQLTCNFTPILQAGIVTAQRFWGWREDMSLENFLDTVVYNYFYEHGAQLGGVIIDEEIMARDKAMKEEQDNEEAAEKGEKAEKVDDNGHKSWVKVMQEV